jgi:hypothetical protein
VVSDVNYSFKWYKPSVGTPIVSVADYGITFNRAAAEEMGNPERIQIGFDENLRLIGVKPIHDSGEEDKDSLPFAGRERNGFTRVNSKDFIRFITRFCPDLKFDRAIRCLARWDEQLGILIVDLNNPVEGHAADGDDQDSE